MSFTHAISGFLAFYIIKLDEIGNRPGWAWIFLLEGLFTILFGISAFFLIPCSPSHFRLLNPKEKEYVLIQLRESGAISHDEAVDSFNWHEMMQAVGLPHVWMLLPLFFFEGKGCSSSLLLYTMLKCTFQALYFTDLDCVSYVPFSA